MKDHLKLVKTTMKDHSYQYDDLFYNAFLGNLNL